MKIELDIDMYSLGNNTEEENARYIKAVENKIKEEYPDAVVDIKVRLCWTNCCVDIDRDDLVSVNVLAIADKVWEDANY